MKRFLLLTLAVLFLSGMAVSAEEAVLIDFSQLTVNFPNDQPQENEATLLDYSNVAGSSFSSEEKQLMKTSLAIQNWEVQLASSSRTVQNQTFSMTREAKVKDDAENFAGEGVMGVRVHFPVSSYNSYALIKPPFDIPAYMDVQELQGDGSLVTPAEERGRGRKFDGYGVVKNVGVLKSVSVNVRGLNFPQGLSLVLKNQNNEEQQIFLGYLDFDGWKTLTWENPNYITEVRNRELRRYPLYPKLAPMTKLAGIVVYRDAAQEGGDFISYIKDVKIVYDKAVLTLDRDIDDENVWGILQDREESRRDFELRRLGNIQVLRYIEKLKMHQEQSAQ